jgi:murein DD-endopeptidase MepM/ murein hydrolase activator NlpD
VPHSSRVVAWLRAQGDRIAPLTGFDLRETPVLGLDLSAGNRLVASNPADNAPVPFTARLFAAMREAGADIGVGGYDEARLIYATDAFSSGTVTDERRTVHIGVDVTMTAGSALFAPLDGVVHGFEDARTRLDYGPVIVLRHDIPAEDPAGEPLSFYTLYGHLDRDSLDGLTIGQSIRAGERFAAIGAPPDNGDWWPHVHVQIITDLLDVPCNFNGVAPASQRRTWLSLSPDANLLLRVPRARLARHLSTSTLLTMRRLHVGTAARCCTRPTSTWRSSRSDPATPTASSTST